MLPRSRRLSTGQLDMVMEKGRVTHSSLFFMKSLPVEGVSRISSVVPKKVGKTAVVRNRLRRKTYEAVRPLYPRILSGNHTIIFAKPAVLEAAFEDIKKDITSLFVKAGLLK